MSIGSITSYLFADRCLHCDQVIENIKGKKWFHSLNKSPYCKDSNKEAEPR